LPSMEEFEKLVAESFRAELTPAESVAVAGESVQPVESTESPEPAQAPAEQKAG